MKVTNSINDLKTLKAMKIQITNTSTGGKSEIIDFSSVTLDDLKVMMEYCGCITIEKK